MFLILQRFLYASPFFTEFSIVLRVKFWNTLREKFMIFIIYIFIIQMTGHQALKLIIIILKMIKICEKWPHYMFNTYFLALWRSYSKIFILILLGESLQMVFCKPFSDWLSFWCIRPSSDRKFSEPRRDQKCCSPEIDFAENTSEELCTV